MNLSKNKKKQIEGIDFNKSYKISDAVKLIKEKNYVKKWVPEFDSESYVDPIIDHKYARERCLNAYKIGLNK